MKESINTIFVEQFKFSNGSALLNSEDITTDESIIFPDNHANCLNWIMGHIIDARNQVLVMIMENPVWDNQIQKCYIRGSQPKLEINAFLCFDELRILFGESHFRLEKGIKNLLAEQLDETYSITAPDGNIMHHTVLEWLTTFSFHESYHAGQTGILRRMLGKEGKIK